MPSALLDAALALVRRGFAVLPLKPRCKEPATTHGVKDASASPDRINAWWTAMPNANVGIATGKPSGGLLVLDVDMKEVGGNGEATLGQLEQAYGQLPPTVEVVTASGRHIYFRCQQPMPSSVALLGGGLDVRADGGYVLAPPSVHPSGRAYAWSADCASGIADAPAWLVDKLVAQRAAAERKPLAHWHSLLTGPITNGTRNSTLTSLTGKLLASGLDVVTTHDLVCCVNEARCVEPLPVDELENLVASIAMRDLRKRGGGGHVA